MEQALGQNSSRKAAFAAELAMLLVPAGMLAVLLSRRVWDVDIFWQLKLGEMILAHHGPILREPFAAHHLGESLPAVGWLGQAIMAGVRLIGGWTLLRLFDALCWLGGFWICAAACTARGASRFAVTMALLLAFAVALPTASIRPQSFAVLCFGALLALQRLQWRAGPTLCLGAILFLVWQNLHPSVTVGIGALGLAMLPAWWNWLHDRERPMPLVPGALVLLAILAVFATPDGFSILAISRTNAEMSIAIGASEWLPLFAHANWMSALRVAAAGVVALVIALRHRDRLDAGEVLVALGLFAVTILTSRFLLFWAVSLVPVMARALTPPDAHKDGERRPCGRHVPNWVAPAGVVAVALLGSLLLPTRFASDLPLAAAARLKAQGVRGTVYGDFPFGGVLIDTGWPAWHVAFDGRYYRYTHEEWKTNGDVEGGYLKLSDVMAQWHPAAFVLNAHHNHPLAVELAKAPAWHCIWHSGGVVVYVPRRTSRHDMQKGGPPVRKATLSSRV